MADTNGAETNKAVPMFFYKWILHPTSNSYHCTCFPLPTTCHLALGTDTHLLPSLTWCGVMRWRDYTIFEESQILNSLFLLQFFSCSKSQSGWERQGGLGDHLKHTGLESKAGWVA